VVEELALEISWLAWWHFSREAVPLPPIVCGRLPRFFVSPLFRSLPFVTVHLDESPHGGDFSLNCHVEDEASAVFSPAQAQEWRPHAFVFFEGYFPVRLSLFVCSAFLPFLF